jgi:hypothetical protein
VVKAAPYQIPEGYDPDILDDSPAMPISYGGEPIEPPEKGRKLSDGDIRRALELCFAVEKPAQADRSAAMLTHLDEKGLETLLLALQGLDDAEALRARLSIARELAARKGGPGSGNWGHSSYTRVGQVGGSDSGGGLAAIGAAPESTPQERAETAARYGRVRRTLPPVSQELRSGIARELATLARYAEGSEEEEAARLLDIEGHFLGEQIAGGRGYVDIPDDLLDRMHVFVHNHPGSASFSGGDISVLLATDAQHAIVYGKNGTIYRLSKTEYTPKPDDLIPSSKIFPRPGDPPVSGLRAIILERNFIGPEEDEIRTRHRWNLLEKVEQGEMTSGESLREASHLATQELASMYGLRYDRWKPASSL